MDPRLLGYYNRELQHLRDMGGEFAKEFPKIAARLGLDGLACADPYVERLLEGFAFLTARVQLKIDAEFPRFTQHLLEMVYPHYLAPTPSMAVVQFQPDLTEGALAEGFTLPRQSILRSTTGKGEHTACEYRTAHEVTLWPLELTEAEYFTGTGPVATRDLPMLQRVRAGIRLRLRTTAGLSFDQLALDALALHLHGNDELPTRLYEQLLANAVAVIAQPTRHPLPWRESISREHIRPLGFDEEDALLPYGPRSFQGYRLLHEYFAFPRRYLFAELSGLAPAVQRCNDTELDLIVLFDRFEPMLQNRVDHSNFALFCSPAINLFPKRCDRIHLSEHTSEYHILPDRTRPLDFEIYQVTEVTGYGTGADNAREFLPFYALNESTIGNADRTYYTVQRVPRLLSSRQRRHGPRSNYAGNEVYVSLVDANEAPFPSGLRQLGATALCTNRDLPLHMPLGAGKTDFTMESGAPVNAVRCLAGPTRPRPSYAGGEIPWRLINHLSLNYLSLADSDDREGAAALRNLLLLYSDGSEAEIRKQVEGVRSISAEAVTRRLPMPGPITFGRGIGITLTLDESAFEGIGAFLLGAVLDRFFAKYVSINSFTQTRVRTLDRGEIIQWPLRTGTRRTL
ncbi:MAG TPA: type VI secretion system baseplate subunit TssF [Sedimenticola sp.]|nr:type VI secretion system baseplate subunit TssF [Sedimenticola sp.]